MIPRPSVGGRGVSRGCGTSVSGARIARRTASAVQAPALAGVASRPKGTKPLTPHYQHQHQDYQQAAYVHGIQSDVVINDCDPLQGALQHAHHQGASVVALPFLPASDGSLGAAALAVVAMQQQQLQQLQRQQHQLELQLQQHQHDTVGASAVAEPAPQRAAVAMASGLHSHRSSVDSFESLMLTSAAAPGTTTINIGSIPIVVPISASLASMGSSSSSAFVDEEQVVAAVQPRRAHSAVSHELQKLEEEVDDDEQQQQQQLLQEQQPVQSACLAHEQVQQQQQQQQQQEKQQEHKPAVPVFKSKLRATSAEFVPGRAYSATLDTPAGTASDALIAISASTASSSSSSTAPAPSQALTVDTSATATTATTQSSAEQQPTAPSTPSTPASPAYSLTCKHNTVTVSARSSVKDAAGAVAKVLERCGVCMLVALRRRAEGLAETTHVAAKTLAVSRFYINTHMGGRGGSSSSGGGGSGGMAEVTFVPFCRQLSGERGMDSDAFSFMVFKTQPSDLDAALPAASGQSAQLALPLAAAGMLPQQHSVPAEQRQQQQEQEQQQEVHQVLKAAAGTDVNKLSNAIIHHVLEHGHTVLQLAGAGACHNAMRALVKARSRLATKFSVGAAVAASFATEDTSGALGRATVFLRLDVVRCALEGLAGQYADRLVAQEQAGMVMAA